MTWSEFAKIYDPSLTDEVIHDLLWTWTAYPFSGLQFTVKQLLSAIRMHRNNRVICWECGLPTEMGHRKRCSCNEAAVKGEGE